MEGLDFLNGGVTHEVMESPDTETIDYILEVLKDTVDEDELWDADDEELAFLKKRADRVKHCNTTWVYIFRANGALKTVPMRCGNYRVCDFCRNGRVIELRGRALRALVEKRKRGDGDTLRVLISSNQEVYPARSSLSKDDYLSLPMSDNNCALFTDCEAEDIPGLDLTYDEIEALDWWNLVVTPQGRRISGNLGKLDEEEEDTVTMQSFAVTAKDENYVNALPEHVKQAYDEAADEVISKYSPKTIDDIEYNLLELALCFRDNLKRIGRENDKNYTVKVHGWYIREKRKDLERISWDVIRAKSETKIPIGTPEVPF